MIKFYNMQLQWLSLTLMRTSDFFNLHFTDLEESIILSSVGLILLNFSPPKLGVNVEDKKEKIREN